MADLYIGDSFVIGDYRYYVEDYNNSVSAVAEDKTKSYGYGPLYSSFVYDGETYYLKSLDYCFQNCTNLTSTYLDVPYGVTTMEGCFSNCTSLSYADVTIPNTVTNMLECFENCTALQSAPLSIPNSVTNMGACFSGCSVLTGPPRSLSSNTTNMASCFRDCVKLKTVPTLPNTVTAMQYCFYRCESLDTAPSIPTSVTNMVACFYGCISLVTAPVIPAGVVNMNACFRGCTSLLAPPTIPNGVTNLSVCFYGCTSLTIPSTMSIPNSVTNMDNCFGNCSSATFIPDIPNSVTSMKQCFYGCTALVHAPKISTSITNMYACFYECSSLLDAPIIPSNVTDMGFCFCRCRSLTEAPVIPTSVTTLQSCFNGCSLISDAPEIPANVTNLDHCFYKCNNLTGNVIVNNVPSNSDLAFDSTVNNIYIIDNSVSGEAVWKTIVSNYSNVHYEEEDNQVPQLTVEITRVSSSGDKTQSNVGTFAYIKATAIIFNNYLPDNWSNSFGSVQVIKKDGASISPTWTITNTDNTYILECWVDVGDVSQHFFALQISDSIKDENDIVRANHLSDTVNQIISKTYKLVDYYHESDPLDPYYNREGMAIGKFAIQANLFDVDMPTLFRDTTECQDMTSQEVDDFVDGLNVSGGGLNIITRSYSVSAKNATYYEETISIGVSGYTPISVGWSANQISTNIYALYFINNSTLFVGRNLISGGQLSSNTVEFTVTYISV